MEIRFLEREREKKKRNDERQMESAVDMTASSLERKDLLLLQLYGCICIYMIPQNADMCWDLGRAECVCACVCVSMFVMLEDLTGTAC